MKLLVAAAALRAAPPQACLRTELRWLNDLPLCDALVLVGGGDALLTAADLQTLAASAAKVLRRQPRTLQADVAHFSGAPWGRGWMWDDGLDALRVSALRLHDDVSPDPTRAALDACAAHLASAGIAPLEILPTLVNATGAVVAHFERPLDTALRAMLERSDNMVAECVLRQLPCWAGASSGDAEQGLQMVRDELRRCGANADALVLADGSGLSRYNLVNAAAITRLLWTHERESPGRLRGFLPRSAASGTLKNRFVSSSAVGRVQAKTGSMQGVTTLAGYLTAVCGRDFAFFASVQHSPAPAAALRAVLDKAVLALVEERF